MPCRRMAYHPAAGKKVIQWTGQYCICLLYTSLHWIIMPEYPENSRRVLLQFLFWKADLLFLIGFFLAHYGKDDIGSEPALTGKVTKPLCLWKRWGSVCIFDFVQKQMLFLFRQIWQFHRRCEGDPALVSLGFPVNHALQGVVCRGGFCGFFLPQAFLSDL